MLVHPAKKKVALITGINGQVSAKPNINRSGLATELMCLVYTRVHRL